MEIFFQTISNQATQLLAYILAHGARFVKQHKIRSDKNMHVLQSTHFFADMHPIASNNRIDRNIVPKHFAMLTARLLVSNELLPVELFSF